MGSSEARVPAPKVVPSYATRSVVSLILSPFLFSFLRSALLEPITINPPTWLRVVVALFVITNYRSTPLAWHWRVLGAAVKARALARPSIHPALPFIRSNKHATTSGTHPVLRLDRLPLGRDIFEDTSSYSFTATLDDSDWNGHLSNSSYPKNLDVGRMAHGAERFLKMHFDGGWMALGGSSYIYHKEIPMLAKYETRISIEAWDDKWLYLVGRFVSPSKKPKSSALVSAKKYVADLMAPPKHSNKQKDGDGQNSSPPCSVPVSKPATPTGLNDALVPSHAQPNADETVYCTSVSRYCFKAGRRTIPPWLIIATSGFGTWASTQTNWDKAESLRAAFLTKARHEHRTKTGRDLPQDGIIAGGGFRKYGLLMNYRLPQERKGTDDEQWMLKQSWQTAEWEERRVAGLERLYATFGSVIIPPNPSSSSSSSK